MVSGSYLPNNVRNISAEPLTAYYLKNAWTVTGQKSFEINVAAPEVSPNVSYATVGSQWREGYLGVGTSK